jgi:hypothetical protein
MSYGIEDKPDYYKEDEVLEAFKFALHSRVSSMAVYNVGVDVVAEAITQEYLVSIRSVIYGREHYGKFTFCRPASAWDHVKRDWFGGILERFFGVKTEEVSISVKELYDKIPKTAGKHMVISPEVKTRILSG